jgi:hypothetical protein
MSRFGKPDATGRSSGIRAGRQGKIHRPPKGEPWVWLTRELLRSDAWRNRGINCARLLDFLMIEHMNHAGTENGKLAATYDQLVVYGLTRSEIRSAIEEAETLGLLRFKRGGRWAGTNQPSRYRLTFLPSRDHLPPTNEWKQLAQENIEIWRHERSATKAGRRAWRKRRKLVRLAALP